MRCPPINVCCAKATLPDAFSKEITISDTDILRAETIGLVRQTDQSVRAQMVPRGLPFHAKLVVETGGNDEHDARSSRGFEPGLAKGPFRF